ncbi:MAG: CoA transferase [Candidatus Binatia bacterium]|nr:CoA transferase [Candidatus Binatia bacterium]
MDLDPLLRAARLDAPAGPRIDVRGADPVLPTRYPAGEAAAAALGLTGAAAAQLHEARTGEAQKVSVDVSGAAMSLVSFVLQKASSGVDLTRHHNPASGLYETRDGRWIHLHGGFPALAQGAVDLLGCTLDANAIADAVRAHDAAELEDAIALRGLCGTVVRTTEEWAEHPQGRALASLPVIEIERIGDAAARPLPPGDRPLDGVRALDLTRVLAGPTCGRTLASYGADVLRIGAERVPSIEPFVIDTGHGKRNAFLDLDRDDDRTRLDELVETADLFCQSYRPGALAARGLSPTELAARRPGIIVVSLDCYGHVGPWAHRPGWEQLAQSATGIADSEARDGRPALIPAAATDYTTGYLAAFGAMTALSRRCTEGGSWHVKESLCQTGMWLTRLGTIHDRDQARGFDRPERFVASSDTAWGRLEHLAPIVEMEHTPARWDLPPSPLGTHSPEWLR